MPAGRWPPPLSAAVTCESLRFCLSTQYLQVDLGVGMTASHANLESASVATCVWLIMSATWYGVLCNGCSSSCAVLSVGCHWARHACIHGSAQSEGCVLKCNVGDYPIGDLRGWTLSTRHYIRTKESLVKFCPC